MSGEEHPVASTPQHDVSLPGAASSSLDVQRLPSKNSEKLEANLRHLGTPEFSTGRPGPVEKSESPEVVRPVAFRPPSQLSDQSTSSTATVRFREDAEAWGKGDSPPSSTTPPGRSSGGGRPQRLSQYPGRDREDHDHVQRRKTVVQRIKGFTYYRGQTAAKMRSFLHGKTFICLMTLALLVALFLPDIWVLAGVNSNTTVDVVLCFVMMLFAGEFVALTLLDATYFLSFFFLMDIVGTVSMIFDISFLVGTDNTKIQTYSQEDSDAKQNLMLLRATRAARVGARAGRLSRVLRILRFLPFLQSAHDEESGGVAASISRQLANLLATRVACLTIILVMTIPAFDILSFPQNDHSLQTWVERLSQDLQERTALGNVTFAIEMESMVAFFSKRDYGPYKACSGVARGDEFVCAEQFYPNVTAFDFTAPNRGGSAMWVHTDDFMVGFNMHAPAMLERGLAILQIGFIIGIMIFSGLALSNVVTELAVRPLERMLKTVRNIAEQVFRMSTGLQDEEEIDEEEEFDINTSTEMKLLEKVVTKLSVIADLQSGRSQQVQEDMGEEDVGILNMMQGKDVVQDGKKQAQRRVSRFNEQQVRKGKANKGRVVQLEEAGMTSEMFSSYAFNTLVFNKQQQTTIGVYVVSRFFDDGDGFIHTEADKIAVERFVTAAEKEYLPNPFHNFSHATDVLHGVARMMRLVHSENFLTELEHFSLLIAAIGHDIGHPGVNNGFLSEVGHELALQYNDLSPLENMHVSKLYGILVNQETNVFAMLSKEQYKEVRKYCIETILHTDMMGHQSMVKDLQMLFQVNSEIFTNGVWGEEHTEIFSVADTKMLVMDDILHSCDVSNPCRTWDVTFMWAQRCLEEFF
jgi:hypothetical protein